MFNVPFFYHQTIRKCVVTFGSMFSDIRIERRDDNGKLLQNIRVPIAFASKAQYLVRLKGDPHLLNTTFMDLPRLSFDIGGFNYDPTRKVNRLQSIITRAGEHKQQYSPVPYNVEFKLYSYTKTQEDALMILEQILPFFSPEYTVTIMAIPEMDTKQDIPFVLSGVTYENAYESDFTKTVAIIQTLSFTAKLNLFGPVSNTGVIKTAIADIGNTIGGDLGTYTAAVQPPTANKDDVHTITEVGP